jgi:hypothetical protein
VIFFLVTILQAKIVTCHSDECVFAGVDLQDHQVTHHVIVDLLVVANMQLVVSFPDRSFLNLLFFP